MTPAQTDQLLTVLFIAFLTTGTLFFAALAIIFWNFVREIIANKFEQMFKRKASRDEQ